MKYPSLTLLTALVLLPVCAQAGDRDEINRLKMQVEMLTDQVARLRSEVDDLQNRQASPDRSPPVSVAAAGTYVLDRRDMEAVIVRLAMEKNRESLESADADSRNKLLGLIMEESRAQARMLHMQVDLHADGTFDTTGSFYDKPLKARGTWKQRDGRIEILTTSEGGIDLEEPVRKSPRLVDGDLVFPPDGELLFEMVLRRKS
jgi:hypothetical protein